MIIDFVMFKSMGDVLMTTPIIHALRLKYPDSQIRFHTLEIYNDLLKLNKEINTIVCYSGESYMAVHKWIKQNPGDMFLPVAMANHFDTCWHHTSGTDNYHMIDWYASRAELPAIEDKHVRFDFDSVEKPADLTNPYIVLHTTTLLETKDWPVQYFNHLAIMLKEKYKMDVVQIGGPNDKQLQNVIDKRGLPLLGTAGVIKGASFFVGVDSGNSYLAESAGIPTFIIMGSTQSVSVEPGRTGPFVGPVGPNVHYFEPNRPDNPNCRPTPCYNHCAIKAPCIVTIKPEDVFQRIEATIK